MRVSDNKSNKYEKPQRYVIVLCFAAVLFVWLSFSLKSYAAEANITFGSESYDSETDAAFPIGVYINADEEIFGYTVLLRYDARRLEYLSGADEADDAHGILTLKGETIGISEVKYWLTFRVISGGEANIAVTDALIYGVDGETNAFTITELGYAPIYLAGADVAGEAEVSDQEQGSDESAFVTDDAIDGTAEFDTEFDADTDAESNADNDAYISGDENASNLLLNPLVVIGIPVIAVLVVAEIIILFVLRQRDRKKRDNKHREKILKAARDTSAAQIAALEEYYPDIDYEVEERLREERGEPVISVNDVTMEFKLYKNVPSGIKEYFIQLIRREVTYRRLYALYHVSFDVFKGEVVGIIGTNGSGKSTVLKIVSGALAPTDGGVSVDRDNLQILTLGTGFDMELSARENVYLNGAIIGYTRDFIDDHYDEIVDFAELWDFMDEKVKNFSSGMVSRLGFAIATAGDAAEILILDEVLSVGDEFFRKKSLARIEEMIHGGSTVLMVSHGIGTIIEHCTKVIWIEKGQLRMIGDPKKVCAAYQKMGGE